MPEIEKNTEANSSEHISEEQYRLLFFNNPFPACIYDIENFKFLEVNDAALEHFGYERDDLSGITLLNVIVPEDIPKLKEELEKAMTDPTPHSSVWRIKKRNGDTIYIESRTNPIQYKGKSARLVLAQDITKRVLAEKELKQSNERYRLATQASFDAIWDADLVTDKMFLGEGFETLFGYWVHDGNVPSSTWADHIHPDDKDRVLKQHLLILGNPEQNFWSDEYRYLKSDGEVAYVIDRGIIIRNEKGKPIRIVGAMQDITDLKRKENELLSTNERFHFATQATSDIIWDWDIRTNKIQCAENYTKVLGHALPPDSKLSFEHFVNNCHPDDRKKVMQYLSEAINNSSQKKWDAEFRYQRGDGTYAYVINRGYIIRDAENKATRLIGAMHDISEQKYQQDILSLELKIFEISSTPGAAFPDVINNLLKGIEEIHPEMYSSVLLLMNDRTMKHLAGPRLPKEYLQMVDGVSIGQNVGSCGTAMYRKEPVIVADIETDPLWEDYKAVTQHFGLKACWSVPIISSKGNVMASFAIYYHRVKSPTEKEWNTVLRIRNLIRLLMENNSSYEQIKLSKERFDIVTDATHDLIWDWDLVTNELFRDPKGLQKVYGFSSNESILHVNKWLERIHPDDVNRVQEVIFNMLNAKEENTFDVEYRFKREDGVYVNIYDRGYILRNKEGKAYRMIGAAQDVTERKKMEEELMNHQKAISQATIDTQERERSEIGKELHDNVNQVLTTTKLYLDLAVTNPELRDELIAKSSKNIINAITEIRQLSRSLMFPSLGDLGLFDSIEDLVEDINGTRKIYAAFIYEELDESRLTDNQKLTMFRIIQEALNNIIKHANATEAVIELLREGKNIKLIIKDNGRGFDPSTIKKGAGLNNIRNRVYLSNGTLAVNTHPGKGCTLVVELPYFI